MKKTFIATLFLMVLAVFGVGLFLTYIHSNQDTNGPLQTDSNKPIVKIGAIIPLTGDFAKIGTSFKNTILLAKEDLAKKKLKNHYEFIIDDDGFEARRTISAFHKQKSMDKVDAVMSFASSTGNVVAPLTSQAKIIYLNVGASDPNIAKGKYNFIHWTQSKYTAKKMAEYAAKQGYKRIVMIGEIDSGVEVILENFTRQAKEKGIDVKQFYFHKGEKNFKLLLQKTKALKPDAYMPMVWGGAVIPFMKQYREMEFDKPLINIEVFSMLEDFNIIEGAHFTDVAQSNDEFVKRLKTRFPDTSSEFAVGNVYDIVMLLVEAFEKAETKEQAVDELMKIKEYEGVTGLLNQDKNGIFQSEAVLKKVVEGKPILIKE